MFVAPDYYCHRPGWRFELKQDQGQNLHGVMLGECRFHFGISLGDIGKLFLANAS
jgi:hypothetical protein